MDISLVTVLNVFFIGTIAIGLAGSHMKNNHKHLHSKIKNSQDAKTKKAD